MDGFDGRKGVVILAATNRPDRLDKALLRPGRFDRRIQMELPDLEGRKAILGVHLKHVKHEAIDLDIVARATVGSSGADLANIVNEAALHAVRSGRNQVTTSDLEESVETIIAGAQRKGKVLSPEEKRTVAFHETGHALVAAMQTHSAPVHKITTGASNDIEQATKLARAMVTRFGMSEKYDMMGLETVSNAYLGGDTSLACSAETAADIDKEVLLLIKSAHQKAHDLIAAHLDIMHKAASYLMERETITGEEFMRIVRKYVPES